MVFRNESQLFPKTKDFLNAGNELVKAICFTEKVDKSLIALQS